MMDDRPVTVTVRAKEKGELLARAKAGRQVPILVAGKDSFRRASFINFLRLEAREDLTAV